MARITQKQIAEEAGVSQQVVSKILGRSGNNGIRFSDETMKRVVDVAQRHNYRLNRSASTLHRKRHDAVGVLIENVHNLSRDMTWALLEAAKDRDIRLIMERTHADPHSKLSIVDEDSIDALILFEEPHDAVRARIDAMNIPVILVNTNIQDRPGSIVYDEYAGACNVVDYLYRKGRRRLAGIGTAGERGSHYSAPERCRGLRDACAYLQIEPPKIFAISERDDFQWYLPYFVERIAEFLQANGEIDGVVLFEAHLAPALYKAEAILGLQIPGNISVIGIGEGDITWSVLPRLTAIRVPSANVVQAVFQRLNELQGGRKVAPIPLTLKPEIYERDSC